MVAFSREKGSSVMALAKRGPTLTLSLILKIFITLCFIFCQGGPSIYRFSWSFIGLYPCLSSSCPSCPSCLASISSSYHLPKTQTMTRIDSSSSYLLISTAPFLSL